MGKQLFIICPECSYRYSVLEESDQYTYEVSEKVPNLRCPICGKPVMRLHPCEMYMYSSAVELKKDAHPKLERAHKIIEELKEASEARVKSHAPTRKRESWA